MGDEDGDLDAESVPWEVLVCAVIGKFDSLNRGISSKDIFEACLTRGFVLPKKSEKASHDEVLFQSLWGIEVFVLMVLRIRRVCSLRKPSKCGPSRANMQILILVVSRYLF